MSEGRWRHDETLERIERKLDRLLDLEALVAIDQLAFDQALTTFTDDLTAGLAAIQAKLAGSQVDLTAELQQITTAKEQFDATVATATGTGTPPAPADQPPPTA